MKKKSFKITRKGKFEEGDKKLFKFLFILHSSQSTFWLYF